MSAERPVSTSRAIFAPDLPIPPDQAKRDAIAKHAYWHHTSTHLADAARHKRIEAQGEQSRASRDVLKIRQWKSRPPTAPAAGRALRVPAGWACGPPFPRPVQSEGSWLGGSEVDYRLTVRVLACRGRVPLAGR